MIACAAGSLALAAAPAATTVASASIDNPPCRVPTLRGVRLGEARVAVRSAHCAIGGIVWTRSLVVRKGSVIATSPRPGVTRRPGTRVRLIVSQGR